MRRIISPKKALFVLSCLILSVAVACGGSSVTTWRAQTSYSPYSYSPPYKAMSPLETALGSFLVLQAQWGDGAAIACTADNRWAMLNVDGTVTCAAASPPETPFALELCGTLMVAYCVCGNFEIVRQPAGFSITPQ